VGDDADCLPLDNHDNVLWYSDTATNPRYAYYFERMNDPFNIRRYSKGLIISLAPAKAAHWDEDTIREWLRFYDKQNIWGD
jgi:hypothetical protein